MSRRWRGRSPSSFSLFLVSTSSTSRARSSRWPPFRGIVRGRSSISSSQSSAFAIRRSVSMRGGRPPDSRRAIADCVVPRARQAAFWESSLRLALTGDLLGDLREEPAAVRVDVRQALSQALEDLSASTLRHGESRYTIAGVKYRRFDLIKVSERMVRSSSELLGRTCAGAAGGPALLPRRHRGCPAGRSSCSCRAAASAVLTAARTETPARQHLRPDAAPFRALLHELAGSRSSSSRRSDHPFASSQVETPVFHSCYSIA